MDGKRTKHNRRLSDHVTSSGTDPVQRLLHALWELNLGVGSWHHASIRIARAGRHLTSADNALLYVSTDKLADASSEKALIRVSQAVQEEPVALIKSEAEVDGLVNDISLMRDQLRDGIWCRGDELSLDEDEDPDETAVPTFIVPLEAGSGDLYGVLVGFIEDRSVRPDRKGLVAAKRACQLALSHALNTNRLGRMVSHDDPSGLLRKRQFTFQLGSAAYDAEKEAEPLSLAMFMVESYETYRKRNGHMQAHRLRDAISEWFGKVTRTRGFGCRYCDDVYAIVFPGMDAELASYIAERIRVSLIEWLHGEDRFSFPGPIRVSGGLSSLPGGGDNGTELLMHADQALLRAVAQGGDWLCVYQGSDTPSAQDPETKDWDIIE